jgi:cystathionine gamma-synthase
MSQSEQPGHRPATRAVVLGRPEPAPGAPVSPPIVPTSTYVARPVADQPGDPVYGRIDNPTWSGFEAALGALEGGTAIGFASGLAAVDAVLAQVRTGGVVVAPQASYNGTVALLDELAGRGLLTVRYVPIAETQAVLDALPGADLLWFETPTNPMLDVADGPALVAAGRRAGALVAVDNTFASPLLQQPLAWGAQVVVHSVTKYLSGHSDLVMGATVTAPEAGLGQHAGLAERLHEHRSRHGAIPGAFEAWLALRGLRTVALRVERAGANAAELARRLQDHPAVRRVRHPSLPADPGHERARAQMSGFGAIVSIEVGADAETAERVCTGTRLWVPATSLGGVESMLERRRRIPGEPEVVPPNLIRLSVGIEDVEDLWFDLCQALDRAR